ncbi:MAG TPA: transcription antitermination factor NusB [Steroidobacteraceae bacterium]|nr:transcription antitermination factor NusB [Steroidobacteraceae bacterium]
MARRPDRAARARSLARKFAMQALYQWQLTGQTVAELRNQYATEEGFEGADRDYFAALLQGATAAHESLDEQLGGMLDRPVAQLDPVEHAVLLIGLYELREQLDVPYRVVINEAVDLTKRFGATDGHKFVNAVLDRAARAMRATEQAAAARERA